jgi:hypothetical protein
MENTGLLGALPGSDLALPDLRSTGPSLSDLLSTALSLADPLSAEERRKSSRADNILIPALL